MREMEAAPSWLVTHRCCISRQKRIIETTPSYRARKIALFVASAALLDN
jgi:hypothetical protein